MPYRIYLATDHKKFCVSAGVLANGNISAWIDIEYNSEADGEWFENITNVYYEECGNNPTREWIGDDIMFEGYDDEFVVLNEGVVVGEEEEEEEEEEEGDIEVVIGADKIINLCKFSKSMAYNEDITADMKLDICNSEEKARTMSIILDITQTAIINEDLELWLKMDKKRKDMVYNMMEALEKYKEDITDNQYLTICNKLKELY